MKIDMSTINKSFALALALILVAGPAFTSAAAYVGPGMGLGVIGAIFGAIAAFFMVIAGLVWYPFKVMLRKRREKKAAAVETTAETAPSPPQQTDSNS